MTLDNPNMPRWHKVGFYGWRRDLPDYRDLHVTRAMMHAAATPARVDLRAHMPAIYDQGNLGSCTANAIAACIEFDQIKQKIKKFIPSRLFIYFEERRIEGTVDADAGAEIRDGMKVVNKLGAPDEKLWPYDIARFRQHPPAACYPAALLDRAVEYRAVAQTQAAVQSVLAAGWPIVFGFSCYESIDNDEVARTGILPMPQQGESQVGGHAVVLCGYDNAKARFIVRNSWGTDWGQKGYFEMPYRYVLDYRLAADFWTVRSVGK
jgi:C1A family cysteine protease